MLPSENALDENTKTFCKIVCDEIEAKKKEYAEKQKKQSLEKLADITDQALNDEMRVWGKFFFENNKEKILAGFKEYYTNQA